MIFDTQTSPHISKNASVSNIMLQVLIAMIPGAIAMMYFFGWGILINLVIASITALSAEAFVLRLRNRPVIPTLKDYSALLTACLLALALPPLAPWWLVVIACAFAIILGKQLYGGVGFNPFNPAMVGYVVVMISFPREMTFWVLPGDINSEALNLMQSIQWSLAGILPDSLNIDSVSSATIMDNAKTLLSQDRSLTQLASDASFTKLMGTIAGAGWEWINLLFVAGGIGLCIRGVADWRIPAGMIISMLILSSTFYLINPEIYLSPQLHLLGGGFMLAAFFIATDPVSASTTPAGRIIFGAGIAVFIFVIRQWGGYPDGIAFSVLLMNMAAPFIDYYTTPKAYGQR